MPSKVGPKGQVVITKPTRDHLGIRPGWEALERVVGDHVELYFVPPPHDRSLKGSLASKIRRKPRGGLEVGRERAWGRAARRKVRRSRP
jgi:bifunctional DNA-binding transcriptional regulator/antitoxin component of YhaV-PrlF toxin-antitoxin module